MPASLAFARRPVSPGLVSLAVGLGLWLCATAAALLLAGCAASPRPAAPAPAAPSAVSKNSLRVAAFTVDATPPLGEPLVWAQPETQVVRPLLAKGVVLAEGADRYVLCVIDWCLVGNDTELSFRRALAAGAGTTPERVSFHSVHQHAAPYADEAAGRLLAAAPSPRPHLSAAFLDGLRARFTAATTQAVARLEPFDRIGTGAAPVERVASYRRIRDAHGKLLSRVSNAGKNPAMAAAPEGDIDRDLRTITFARGDRPLVRLHYYATHPQTFCCDGRVSWDFVGDAREALEKEEGVPQLYFSACGSDVTVGKYNDTTAAAYDALVAHLGAGLRAAITATRYAPAEHLVWRTAPVFLPPRAEHEKAIAQSRAWVADPKAVDGLRVYQGAMRLAWFERQSRPVPTSSLQIGSVWIAQLPGEPMLEFQRYARSLQPAGFVAVAGYGDCGPAYVCTDAAIADGGYEPLAANVGRGTEGVLKGALRDLLGGQAAHFTSPAKK